MELETREYTAQAGRIIKAAQSGRLRSDTGGDNIADAMTLIESAKLSRLNPHDYLADVLARINEHKINRLHELLPWNWKPVNTLHRQAA
ncbi:hypothetical protein KOEU_23230 [Komagataeibacter europaeus]|uniref:Transposase IS66 C-terminal domain-containing protein n=3 Tax=Acetobacteraceae TaxID=433 RepID=A0A1Y0XZQ0_ACEPA|nr:transposase domain-containing protein [Acetobacter pasteurianus]ARW48410.1 uncharacterized protein S1001342_02097 [Acetobacter pasteurianus subsp. pasteurianus]KON64253.1 hypothetical protein KOEU_23230 [Komagataeibacter europaeus]